MIRLLVTLLFLSLVQLDARHYRFKVGNCEISPQLSQRHDGAAVFLSYDLLEELLENQLKANGFRPRPGEKFVEFPGRTDPARAYELIIRGDIQQTAGMFRLTLKLDGRYYKESLDSNEIVIDAEVGLKSPPRNFAEALMNIISTPINLVMATVISVVFPFINEQLGETNDYLNASVQGKYNPMTPLIVIAKQVADFFLSWFGASTGPMTYPVSLKFTPQTHLMTVFNALSRFETGVYSLQTAQGSTRGIRVQLK